MTSASTGFSVLSALFVLACSSGADDRPAPIGELQYDLRMPSGGCEAPCSVLANDTIALTAFGKGADVDQELFAYGSTLVTVGSRTSSCECRGDDGDVRPVMAGESCKALEKEMAAPLTKACTYEVVARTHSAGAARLNFSRADGTVIGSLTFDVREAVELAPSAVGPGPKQTRPGRTLVYVGAKIKVLPRPKDATGKQLAHHLPPSLASSDGAVLSLDPDDAWSVKAETLGAATLTVKLGDLVGTVEIDVVEP